MLKDEKLQRQVHAAEGEIGHALAEWQRNGRQLKADGHSEDIAEVIVFAGKPAHQQEESIRPPALRRASGKVA